MQTVQRDRQLNAEIREDPKARRIQTPERNTLIVAGAITGGAIVAGLIFYYLRKRSIAH